jgi:xanthine dehydrogenase small subunit
MAIQPIGVAEVSVRFLLDGSVVEIANCDPTATLLNHLRYELRRTGTKEGCAEGDCGACTVLVGALNAQGTAINWRAVNACILFLPMVNGKAVLTVESLAQQGELNPLQAVMAKNGSSQCGFCTPGFVMSLYGRCIGANGHDLPAADALAGNLCRCTGYGPILAAAEAVGPLRRDDDESVAALHKLAPTRPASGNFGDRCWFAPKTCDTLTALLDAHPDARIVAGATDVGLWVTKKLMNIDTLIFIADIPELYQIEDTAAGLTVGAAVRHADLQRVFTELHPDLGELLRRFAGLQVRNSGTIGGNIANGSPIGDGPPAYIALGATVTLRSSAGRRTLPIEDYFIAYGKQDRRAGEFVESIFIPRPDANVIVHISKLSRRFDSDISAVCGAFKLTVRDSVITNARIAFGGMAGTPKRAHACETALIGKPFTETSLRDAAEALAQDYQPLTDVRGSATYRLEAAANLLLRVWHQAQGKIVSVLDLEPIDG